MGENETHFANENDEAIKSQTPTESWSNSLLKASNNFLSTK